MCEQGARRGEMTRRAYRKWPLNTFLYVGFVAVRHEDYGQRARAGLAAPCSSLMPKGNRDHLMTQRAAG